MINTVVTSDWANLTTLCFAVATLGMFGGPYILAWAWHRHKNRKAARLRQIARKGKYDG